MAKEREWKPVTVKLPIELVGAIDLVRTQGLFAVTRSVWIREALIEHMKGRLTDREIAKLRRDSR